MPATSETFRETRKALTHRTGMEIRPDVWHWPEYFIEAGAIGAFMVSAAVFAITLYHPSSPVAASISNEFARRSLMGLAMGLTAVAIIYSRWGQRSGAHMNPAITLTFYHLGRIAWPDLLGYLAGQFAGGILGIAFAAAALGTLVSHPSVNYVATTPGPLGESVAFAAEGTISFVLMLTVLALSNHPRLARFTGICAGALVWTYITFEQPLSGMSMNPARTFGSALLAWDFPGLWIYFTAPLLGMLFASEVYTRRAGIDRVLCAKFHHPQSGPCIFHCDQRRGPAVEIEHTA
jgi:aquaporin Z